MSALRRPYLSVSQAMEALMSQVIAVPRHSPSWDDDTLNAALRAWCMVVLLIYLGLMTLAAEQTLRLEQPRECGPFIIGQSSLGGCDWLG
jgi:hypothetical protein